MFDKKTIIGHWHFPEIRDDNYVIGNSMINRDERKERYVIGQLNGNINRINYAKGHRFNEAQDSIHIADLHIQSGRISEYGYTDEDTVSYLKYLVSMSEVLIIHGDLFELKQPLIPFCEFWEYRKIRRDYPKTVSYLLEQMKQGNIIYLYGNHDKTMKRIWGVQERITLLFGKNIIVCEHGHKLDESERGIRGILNSIGLYLLGLIERIFPDIDKNYH